MENTLRTKFLEYSASEPMTVLRKRFNQGESVYKQTPDEISAERALEDVLYVQYVLENAYSGYPYHSKALFEQAFINIKDIVQREPSIRVNRLIDVIVEQLSFINDGHLSFTTADYGRGFYSRKAIYVSNMLLKQKDGQYIDTATNRHIELLGSTTVFPTVTSAEADLFLVGEYSKTELREIDLLINGSLQKIPVHKIRSRESAEEVLILESYDSHIATVTCGTFVGDSGDDLQKYRRAGEKCRNYPHVIWDLSNNLGGNSAFAEQFLIGLNGGFQNTSVPHSLQSSLVYAKEHGELKEVVYDFSDEEVLTFDGENLFTGTLHVIINDCVASSGELALIYAKTLPKVIFYGCSTLGIGHFGDLCIYYLPHSQITLWCPQKVFQTIIPETVGMCPDFWIDSHDVTAAVKQIILSGILGNIGK